LGYTNRAVLEAWRQAGYQLGRTTEAFRWSYHFDPSRMPVTVEFSRATRWIIARHAARDFNVLGLWRWLRRTRLAHDPGPLAQRLYSCVAARGGVFHLLGRSDDNERLGLWDDLKSLLAAISARPSTLFLTNSQVLEAAHGGALE